MHDTTRMEIDEALRQRESSPGLDQEELVRRCSGHAHGDEEYLNPNSPVGITIWHVYLGGVEAASHFSQVMFAGVDMTEGYDS
jgi:hypothetical protein